MSEAKKVHISEARFKSEKDFDKCFIRDGDLVCPSGWNTFVEKTTYDKLQVENTKLKEEIEQRERSFNRIQKADVAEIAEYNVEIVELQEQVDELVAAFEYCEENVMWIGNPWQKVLKLYRARKEKQND